MELQIQKVFISVRPVKENDASKLVSLLTYFVFKCNIWL